MLDVSRHGQRLRLKSWKSSWALKPVKSRPRLLFHLASTSIRRLRLTHQQLDKSTSTYFRLVINVFISRRRLILHPGECSITKVTGYALDVDLFRIIRLIHRSQVDLSILDDRQMPTQGKEGFPRFQSWVRIVC